MKAAFKAHAAAAAIIVSAGFATDASAAGVIDRACRASDRPAASPQLCRCIQGVANRSLNASERRKVAKWFSDPHRAQEIRMSDRRSDEALWERYKAFGQKARATCG
jgi:hypothetical protein